MMNSIDVTIIIASLVLVVATGLWASRDQDKSAKGYFLASGRMPWWLIGAGFVATSVSSEQIVGTAGAAYKHGMGIANWEWFAPNKFLMIVIFIPIYLRNRITTIPDLLSRRYGPLCADIYSWIMLVAYVFIFMPPVLYGGSLAFSELTGWDFYAVLWSTVVLVALYTVHGGLKAVMWTDAIQCVMLVGGGLLLFFVAVSQISGGWTAMVAAAPERFHLYHPPDDPMAPFLGFLGATVGLFLFYSAGSQVPQVTKVLSRRAGQSSEALHAGVRGSPQPLRTAGPGLFLRAGGQSGPVGVLVRTGRPAECPGWRNTTDRPGQAVHQAGRGRTAGISSDHYGRGV